MESSDSYMKRFIELNIQYEVCVRVKNEDEIVFAPDLVVKTYRSKYMFGNCSNLFLLYDKLESQLLALDTLGITSKKYAAMLFPLVESCLPSDLLRVWQRSPDSPTSTTTVSQLLSNTPAVSTIENRLNSLMIFFKGEVNHEQYVALAAEGFELTMRPAQKLSWEQKHDILKEKGACFRCLKHGHQSQKCRVRMNCVICGKSHVHLMCRELSGKSGNKENSVYTEKDNDAVHQALTNCSNEHVFLQMLRVCMENGGKTRYVRGLIDTGSQKTYVLKSTAKLLEFPTKRQINMVHGLFGGGELSHKHDCYDVKLSYGNYSCTFEALDQPVICSSVASIFRGPWTEELCRLNIQISDSVTSSPIEVQIGSDITGKLYTGRRHILQCGLVAVESLLGWMGKIPLENPQRRSMTFISLFTNHVSIANLWELDVLGIKDPAEKRTREETAIAAKELFLGTIKNCAVHYPHLISYKLSEDSLPDEVDQRQYIVTMGLILWVRTMLLLDWTLEKLRKVLASNAFNGDLVGVVGWVLGASRRNSRQVQVGDIVLVGNDQEKRIHWPLGRVVQLFPGKDGQVRLVKLLTERGQLMRPIQRLYPLECTANSSGTQGDGVHKEEGVWSPFVKQPDKVAGNGSDSADPVVSNSRAPETKASVTRRGRKIYPLPRCAE
ncbi:hypothetical protein YQE_04685, partial [Dendroctonus ponderosae]